MAVFLGIPLVILILFTVVGAFDLNRPAVVVLAVWAAAVVGCILAAV